MRSCFSSFCVIRPIFYIIRTTAPAEWVLYTDPEDPSAADVIRLIFAEAGVTYQECNEPYDSIEVIGGKEQEYPVLNPPVVRKGN